MKLKTLKRAGAGLALTAALLGTNAVLTSKPAEAAAGFMGNSFGLAKANKSMNPTVLGALGIAEFVFYWMPPVWMLFTIGGLAVTSNSRDEGPMKMVGGISIAWLFVMALLFWYDTSAVPSAGGIQASRPMLELFVKAKV